MIGIYNEKLFTNDYWNDSSVFYLETQVFYQGPSIINGTRQLTTEI
jgi:hypothetical protein